MVPGAAACQSPPATSLCSRICGDLVTVNIRSIGSVEAAAVFSGSKEMATVHSMLLCPLQTQASPTRTSLTSILLLPTPSSVNGPPARKAGRIASHVPSVAVMTDADFP